MSQPVEAAARQGFSLYDYLKGRRRGIFNVLVASGFISYALLDHGLGRILLWSYFLTLLLMGVMYRLYYHDPKRSFRVPKRERFGIYSWREAYSVSTSDINLILGLVAWSFFWFAVGTAFCVVTFGTLILTIGCAFVASFDFLWDWHINLHPYLNLVTWWLHLSIWN